eukprot:1101448-Pleurochrysis_carterae.AAC.2
MRSGNFVFESSVSRGVSSRFAIEGKSEHADMSTHDDLACLAATAGVGRIFFDQCVFGAPTSKATQLIASDELLSHLSPKFSEKFCDQPPGTHNSIVGMAANGAAYRTKAAQHYPSEMNAALADSILALLPATAAVLRDAGGESEVGEEGDDMFNPLSNGDADIAAAYGLKAHGDDNPTLAQAMMKGESLLPSESAARSSGSR